MKLDEAKQRFVEAWGTLGTNWGINRTMAQIHALLLVTDEPLSTDQIMEILDISRGNVNMNMRALIDWGLAERRLKTGERMEFFTGEKDIWKVAVKIIRERRKREIDPLRSTLRDLRM
ncbi:MAG: transcriptional regulator, partial [Bacteroidetes bacterium]|nr:transcriptional regulator [Bacteroidota bacterium]